LYPYRLFGGRLSGTMEQLIIKILNPCKAILCLLVVFYKSYM
jgi:hypothetical protein